MSNKFVQLRDYDLSILGERADAIPGSEPKLNRDAAKVIPVCEPDLRGNESQFLMTAVKSGWISSKGSFVGRFENDFSGKVGAGYGCAVSSGTTALHLCLAALGVVEGDEVIIPTFTMVATANAAAYLKAKPVLVGSDENYCLHPQQMQQAITNKTKAIIPVHIYGHPVNIDAIRSLAGDIPVIYDAAEAHGSLYRSQPIGGCGLASVYSFFGNKTITTGEGGMIVSNNEDFIKLCRALRDMAFSDVRHFWHQFLGYNYRMTNMQAGIGCAQVERFSELVCAREENGRHYRELLDDVPGIKFQPERPEVNSSCWMVGIEVDKDVAGLSRDELRQSLADCGIETRTYFVPIHLQPYYYQDYKDLRFDREERLSAVGLYLPSSSLLTDSDREYVAAAITQATS